jgi:tetratricopeptide (TPR) repeat protein
MAVYSIPFLPNRTFVGRRAELDALKQRLLIDKACYKMSIVGLGGTGKTQVALQFAYMVKNSWPELSIFWVPALSMESFEQACTEVTRQLGILLATHGENDVKEQFKQHLGMARLGRWLLVVDNADDADILFGTGQVKGIVDYLPQSEEGIILFTTRTLEVADSLTRGDVLELGPMDRQDASEFLEKLIRKDLFRNIESRDALLDELTCLPLAISQAAAYLNKTGMSIAKYLQLLRSTEQDLIDLMSREFRDNTRYHGSANAVATTWLVSFDHIRARDAIAADLLLFVSCIEWKAIPRSILPRMQSEVRMEEAIGTLRGYSFLVKRGEEDEYDVHRLVHLATRIWVSKYGDARRVADRCIRTVAGIFPSHDYANRAVWRAYLPHALRLLEDKQDCEIEERSKLCLLVGRCLRIDGRVREAVRWLEEFCVQRQSLDKGIFDQLLSQHELGIAYRENRQIRKAVKLLEGVVAAHTEIFAEDHASRLASQHELAIAYRENGQIKEAVKLLEDVVSIQAGALVEDHPDRLTSQHVLATAYQANGQIKEAFKLLEGVVAIRTKLLEEDHPSRLASQHALGVAYRENGQIKEAIKLLESVVAIRTRVLEEDHPSHLASQHALARAYEADGQVQKAIERMEHVVAVKARVFKDDHPSKLVSTRLLEHMYAGVKRKRS